ncbi:hypothetical protein Fmac_019537 [Flemingia macrophylla]|uniref:Uncharacterized protein n=1 Tax=Flemingia macrophylla TaxID=520843 RepID=A0ABD1M848_9FABA
MEAYYLSKNTSVSLLVKFLRSALPFMRGLKMVTKWRKQVPILEGSKIKGFSVS